MGRFLPAIAALCAAGTAHADGTFPSPDGTASVVNARGEAALVTGGEPHALGRMPVNPDRPLGDGYVLHVGGLFERAYWSADSRRVAVVGWCRGYSGVSPPPLPHCAGKFIRIVDRDAPDENASLGFPWGASADAAHVQTLVFDPAGGRVAAIVMEEWSDCSWEGIEIFLRVWDLRDGSLVLTRELADRGRWLRRTLDFDGDAVRVTAARRTRTFRLVQRASRAF